MHRAIYFADNGLPLRTPRLEQLFNAGQTLGNIISAGDATGMEGAHGQLCARLTDRLRGNDTDGLANLHHAAGSQVAPIALDANAIATLASQDAPNMHLFDESLGERLTGAHRFTALNENPLFRRGSENRVLGPILGGDGQFVVIDTRHRTGLSRHGHAVIYNFCRVVVIDEFAFPHDNRRLSHKSSRHSVAMGHGLYVGHRHPADDAIGKVHNGLFAVLDGIHYNAHGGATICLADNDILGDIHEASRQVARIRSADGGVGRTFARAMS